MRALILLFLLAGNGLLAQDPAFVVHTPRNQYLFPEDAPPAYVFRDEAPLRSAPSTSAAIVARLSPGTALSLDSLVQDTLEVDGVLSYWYQVSTGKLTGYLWGGSIAQFAFGSHGDPNVKFLAGLDHITPPGDTTRIDYSYRITAVRHGDVLDRIVVRSFAWSFEQVTSNGDRGMMGLDDIITLAVPCSGGCGCATGEVVVFWSGGQFHHVADLMGSPDAEYSTNTMFLYPSDMEGVSDAIIRVVSDYEEPKEADMEEGTAPYLIRTVLRERLWWNGTELESLGMLDEKRFRVVVDY